MIDFEAVSYSYSGRELFSDVNISLAPGSFHFLTGPSGAGKTTLMKLCYAELTPERGNLTVLGKNTRQLTRADVAKLRRRVGVVHQECKFLDHLSVAENVALPLTVSGQESKAKDYVPELLNWVGLSKQAGQTPPELSGGEKQRAALARAIVLSPEILIADEPTGNIDWDMSQRLLQLMIELNKLGRTVLFATHDLTLIRAAKTQVNARVLRLKDGNVQIAGASL